MVCEARITAVTPRCDDCVAYSVRSTDTALRIVGLVIAASVCLPARPPEATQGANSPRFVTRVGSRTLSAFRPPRDRDVIRAFSSAPERAPSGAGATVPLSHNLRVPAAALVTTKGVVACEADEWRSLSRSRGVARPNRSRRVPRRWAPDQAHLPTRARGWFAKLSYDSGGAGAPWRYRSRRIPWTRQPSTAPSRLWKLRCPGNSLDVPWRMRNPAALSPSSEL